MIGGQGSTLALWWRRSPGEDDLAAVEAAASSGPHPAVFLQGEAVDWVADPVGLTAARRASADWQVCIGSWRRRHPDCPDAPLPAPFRAATLTQWLDHICPAGPVDATPELLFDVGRAPRDGRDRIETLEPILAAASLDRDVMVLVHGDGRAHLDGPGAEAWDQLTDFDLAELRVVHVPAAGWSGRGMGVEPETAARLRREVFKLVTL